jgi:hypothetical protein
VSAAAEAPAKCPYNRHLSYITWQYSISLGYADLTLVMDGIDAIWQRVEDVHGPHEGIGDEFAAVLDLVERMREWTGWGGIPEKLLEG